MAAFQFKVYFSLAIPWLLMFCYSPWLSLAGLAEKRHEATDVNITVTSNTMCAEYGEFIFLVCNVTTTTPNKTLDSWSLSWLPLETRKHLINLTRNGLFLTSRLGIRVNWTDEKSFWCIASWPSSDNRNLKNVSRSTVVRVKPSRAVTKIFGKFSETRQGQRFEVSWTSKYPTTSVGYSAKYCLEADEDEHDIDTGLDWPICPHVKEITSHCLLNNKPRTSLALFKCEAYVRYGWTAPTDIKHKVYIINQRNGSQCVREHVEIFTLSLLPNFEDATSHSHPLILIPYPVENVRVMTSKHRTVNITWSDPTFVRNFGDRGYMLKYNCSVNATMSSKELAKTNIRLLNTDFHPYHPFALCNFCVKARISKGSPFSNSLCTSARLHEERPSRAPTITCSGTKCETVSKGGQRNVTVTWDLPPRDTWNGDLTEVTIDYRQVNHSENQEVSVINLTEKATVLTGLERKSSYLVQIRACNAEGCSEFGNATWISLETTNTQGQDTNDYTLVVVHVVLVVVVIVLFTIALFLLNYRRRKREKAKRGELPTISEENIEPFHYQNVAMSQSSEYTELGEPFVKIDSKK